MTKEELKQEARQKALEWNGEKINGKYNRPPIANWSCYEKGYLAGAEPREKRISELIALINAERKRQEECDDVHLRKISELEKENAELKHTIAELRRDKDNLNMHTKAQEKLSEYRSDQLTKAKELIERLLITSCNSDVLNLLPNCSEVLRVRVEAEQFLKGE